MTNYLNTGKNNDPSLNHGRIIPKDFLDEWKQMRDDNAHSHEYVEIADWALVNSRPCVTGCFVYIKQQLKVIAGIHGRDGYLLPELSDQRHLLYTMLMAAIGCEFGEEAEKQARSCT